MIQLKVFSYHTYEVLEEKFNWWMSTHKPKQIINISFQPISKVSEVTTLDDGTRFTITVLYDDDHPQKVIPFNSPLIKARQ